MSRISASLVAAALACVAALLVLGATLAGALSIESVRASAPAARTDAHTGVANATTPPLSSEALMLAVEHDPFRPDRQRAPERYRMPGEEPPVEPEPPPPAPPPPPFRLIGTAVSPTGSVAVIELESSSRMLEIGEELLGYRLMSVEPERATMDNGEQRVDLPLTSSLAAVAGRDQRRNNRMQSDRPDNMRPEPDRGAAAARARELIERIRQSGSNVPPELLEQLRRLQAEGRNVEVQEDRGRFMIRTRPDTTSTRPPRMPEP